MKVYIEPRFRGADKGDGGIRRIVEAQRLWLPRMGVEVVDELEEADLVATHAGMAPEVPQDIPWVVHTHGLYWDDYEWPGWCHRLNREVIDAVRKADHVTAPSEWVAYALKRAMWLRPTVLHHGIDLEDWEPAESQLGYVLWNKNRPDPVCDPTPVIELASRAPDLKFITTFGREQDNVRVTGRVEFETMKELIRNAGVYLCTTRETFGIGTLEAMAAGVPVVGWAWGGQREIIEHRKTGWLCPPGDYGGLLDGIKWALRNRKVVGKRARAAVKQHWTWERRMQDYVTLYSQLLDEKAQRQRGPRVSVVTPCYNLARYLPETIASLEAQTMQDWEVIIVDDASPDDTAAVAAALALDDPRIKVVTNEHNLYLAGALNRGIQEARGRYILPLDADNMIEPWTLEVLAGSLDQDRGVDIAYGACRFVLEDGVTRDTSVSPDGVSGWPQDFSFRAQMLHRNQVPSTCMYRKEVWERTGGYRLRCRTAEDAEFWTRASSLGFVPQRVTSRPTLIYRQRPDSMSRVEPDWDWTAWFPWSRHMDLVPFGVEERPPARMNDGISWSVPSYEPAKIAIIIPVGPGHQDLVLDALDSVQAQTYRAWECIVVNDTGQPLAIPHPWATVIDTLGEEGPGAARNAGIAASKAALFVPLDADDFLQSDALALMMEVGERDGGVVYGQWWDDKADGLSLWDPPEYDAQLLVSKGCIHAVTALYPKSAWAAVGGFDPTISHWEDWDFQIKMAAQGVCGTKIPRPLFTYRKETGLRREANMAARDEGKSAILAKWSKLWDGRETLMACGSCPGGGGNAYSSPPSMQSMGSGQRVLQPREGYVILQYNGASVSTRIYRGKQTGTQYRFGNTELHRTKYVYGQDVPELMELMDGGQPLFKVITPSVLADQERPQEPQLVAAGSPVAQVKMAEPTDGVLVNAAAGQSPSIATQDYSVAELRTYSKDWSIAQLELYLGYEEGKEEPRPTAVTLLRGRLNARS